MKIFIHTDLDGRCCGAILTRVYPEATLVNYNYFYDPETSIDRIEHGESVIFADITPTMENLRLAMTHTSDITIIDHHGSSLRDLKEAGLEFPGIQTEDGIGACALVWDWCFEKKGRHIPFGVKCIAEYDGWKRTGDNKKFHFGIQTFSTFPTNRIWDRILNDDGDTVAAILGIGKNVLSYIVPWYKKLIRSYSIRGTVDDLVVAGQPQKRYRALLINQASVDSSIFDDCEEEYDIYLRVVFGKGWKWLISITTNRDDIDVSAIAREYGGGGHKASAGCSVEDLSDIFKPLETESDRAKFRQLPVADSVHP